MAEGKAEAEVTYNQTIAEEKAKGEVSDHKLIRMITLLNLCLDVYSFSIHAKYKRTEVGKSAR